MESPIVVSLGEALWDILPQGNHVGGAPLNFAYHAMHNGAQACCISALGDDDLGNQLEHAILEHNIMGITQHNTHPTGTVQVELHDGVPEYDIIEHVAWDYLEYQQPLQNLVNQADCVCFGTLALRNERSHNTILQLLRNTPRTTLKFFDINIRQHYYSKQLIEELLSNSTIVKCNDDELLLLQNMFHLRISTAMADATYHLFKEKINYFSSEYSNFSVEALVNDIAIALWIMRKYGLSYMILTMGSYYSVVVGNGELSIIPTPLVDVDDTIGAGDAFSGAFTAQLLCGKSLFDAHVQAVNVAAFVCTQSGAWPHYPTHIPEYV